MSFLLRFSPLAGVVACGVTLLASAAWIALHAPRIARMASDDPRGTLGVVASLWWLWLIFGPLAAACVWLLSRILKKGRVL